MPKLSEIITKKPITVLEYGPSGSGKTSLIGEASKYPELCPIYIADFDGRIDSLRATLTKENMANIYSDNFDDGKLVGSAWMTFEAIATNPDSLDKKYGVIFKTICMDSLTFGMRAQMARIQLLAGKQPGVAPTLPEYGSQGSGILDILTKLRGCGRNIIVTAHEAGSKDDVTGRMFKSLDVIPSLVSKTPGLFNEFWHTEILQAPGKEIEYVIRVRPDITYSARTSFRTLDSVEKQGLIWKKIVAQLAAEQLKVVP